MVGILANRGQFGLILPSTNTSVEAEFNRMLVPGVSWHSGRIFSANPDLSSSEKMEAFLVELRGEMQRAVESVLHAKVDYLTMGMSAETFWGGESGAQEFVDFMGQLSGGLGITTGAAACGAVIKTYSAKKIGIITPYQPVGDQQVVDFFTQIGCEVHAIHGMKCASATSISEVSPEEVRAAFLKVDAPDVDLLIQAGTNLLAGQVAAKLEVELGKPVIAINTATVWHTYRSNGIKDQIKGWGSLLEKH
ncbi:Asp/Glu/hydantoin racemase [Calycina marina]|uniref:Asp/Glu/hydantoin racemase n=1 Tax=Calycina marina TaxID=1763456 RepID=A0A9P7ZB80_9HELO|nr:Asp/Glu/hydantoin racemase [Calycina marina]